MRNALSIAAGASSETSEPIIELIRTRSMLISPSPIETGSISISTRRTSGSSRRGRRICQIGKPSRRSGGIVISSCTSVPATHADRVRVDASSPSNSGVSGDQPGDDHEVPDQRRDRGDRELVVGVEDPDRSPLRPSSTMIGNRTCESPTASVVELLRELVAGEQRDDHAGASAMNSSAIAPSTTSSSPHSAPASWSASRGACARAARVKTGTKAARARRRRPGCGPGSGPGRRA